MSNVNGLPIGFFVILGGIILVLVSWLVMRFGRTIGKAVVTVSCILIAGIIALAVLAQSASSYQTAQAAERVAKVAQTSANTNMIMVAMVGLFAGVAMVATLGAVAIAVYFWLKSKREPAQLATRSTSQQIAEPEPMVWHVGIEQSQNQQQVDLSNFGW